MRPVLFSLGDLKFPSYYTLLTVGFMLATFLAWWRARDVKINRDDFLDMSLYMLIAGLIGARLLHVFADGYFWDYVHLCTDPLKVEVPSFIHVHCQVDADCVSQAAGALCNPATGRCHPAQDCFAALKFWQGGLAFYGGLILAVVVAIWFIRRRKMPMLRVMDLSSWGISLGLVFGRTGCLLAGCCFGAIASGDAPAIEFEGYVATPRSGDQCKKGYDLVHTDGGNTVCAFGRPAFMRHVKQDKVRPGDQKDRHTKLMHSLPVHPTQPYSAAGALLIFAYLYFWRRRHIRFEGQAFWEFSVLYGLARFAVEFFRDDDRGLWLGDTLSTSQLIALPLIFFGAYMLWRGGPAPNYNEPEPAEPTKPADPEGA